MIRPPANVGSVILCSDIIKDINNRLSFIGCYTHDIVIGQVPSSIRLALYVEVYRSARTPKSLDLRLTFEGEEAINVTAEIPGTPQAGLALLMLPGLDAHFGGPGTFRGEIRINTNKWELLFEKKIIVGPVEELASVSVQAASDPNV